MANFENNSQFAFHTVNMDSEIINCNDVKSNFPFESYFSVITINMVIEKKMMNALTIPFKESAKLLTTNNFSISRIGDSYEYRKIEIEFSDWYNRNHKLLDDYGTMSFTGWDDVE